MVYTGDEGIKQKFFNDLKRLFPQTPQLDGPLPEFQNVGLKSNQIDPLSQHSNEFTSEGDETIGKHSMQFPIRPDADDCEFFIRTGTCKFGSSCKFNHPVSTTNLVDQDKSSSKIVSQIPCKFYSAGVCKYGESCTFNHSKPEADKPPLQLNIFGFPKRLGKMNCSFYIRTGMCGYASSCRFNHPDPVMVLDPAEDYTPKREPCDLNDVGLPIRPGKKVCWNYENLGLCKSGRACAYDHPKKCSSTYGSTLASRSGVKTQENDTPEE